MLQIQFTQTPSEEFPIFGAAGREKKKRNRPGKIQKPDFAEIASLAWTAQ